MPVWLRNFTYQQIVDYKQKEQEAMNKASGNPNSTSANIGDAKIPEHMKKALADKPRKPSYTTKASKK